MQGAKARAQGRQIMSESDIFREVEEDIRREEIARLWDRYGLYVLVGALLIVFGVAIHNAWSWWSARQAAESGAAFTRAVALAGEGKTDAAAVALSDIARDAPGGYRLLARLRLAALDASRGRVAEAVAVYDAIADNETAGEMFRGLARIRAATLRLDVAGWNEMYERLDRLNSPENPWRHSAKELLGLSAYRTGSTTEAERMFGELLGDGEAPRDLKQRAEMMLALLVKTGANGSGQSAKEEPQSHAKDISQTEGTGDGGPRSPQSPQSQSSKAGSPESQGGGTP